MQSLYGHSYHQRLFHGGSPLLRPQPTFQPFPEAPGKEKPTTKPTADLPASQVDPSETLDEPSELDLRESGPEIKPPESEPELELEEQSEIKLEDEPEIKPESEWESEPETQTEIKLESEPEPQQDIETDQEVSISVEESELKNDESLSEELKTKETAAPWHREDTDKPPAYVLEDKLQLEEKVREQPDENPFREAKLYGKLLSTPSRLLKVLLPLPTKHNESELAPLALLVHPQQPLSYLERLIQSELPGIDRSSPPEIAFRALDRVGLDTTAETQKESPPDLDLGCEPVVSCTEEEGLKPSADDLENTNLVRWSLSTEIGDFIRDASRSSSFVIEIQPIRKSPNNKSIKYPPIIISIPTFDSRTYFLRSSLRNVTSEIKSLQDLKAACDKLAHRSAQRVAVLGLFALISYWALVFRLTFMTSLGWDVMEPVTYLTGLSMIVLGYLWFLWNGREVSYHGLMRETVSRRQMREYERKGFDMERWEELIKEGKKIRREIREIAEEYGIMWDEDRDEVGGEGVRAIIKEETEAKKVGGKMGGRKEITEEKQD